MYSDYDRPVPNFVEIFSHFGLTESGQTVKCIYFVYRPSFCVQGWQKVIRYVLKSKNRGCNTLHTHSDSFKTVA
jgi:hypothetical protein